VKIDGATVTVKGARGQLTRTFSDRMTISLENGVLTVTRPDDNRASRALHGLTRALLNNMVVGVSEGFVKKLEIQGVGYRVMKKGAGLEFSLGYSHPIVVDPPKGITFTTDKPTELAVEGIDRQLVGQVAADIRKLRKPEPYKGKGVRYADEQVRRKAGKTAVK